MSLNMLLGNYPRNDSAQATRQRNGWTAAGRKQLAVHLEIE